MKRREIAALLLSMVLVGCESRNPGPSFSQNIVPILNRHCVMCHMDGGAQGELSLHPQPYTALVGVASSQSNMLLVAPGDVQASYFYHKLKGSHLEVGGEGEGMPYQRDLLSVQDLSTVEQWIAQGANNN